MTKKILAFILAMVMMLSLASFNVFAAEDETVEIKFRLGDETLMINDEAVTVEKPYAVGVGVTLVPVRVITEAFGAVVTWIGDTQSVKIEYPDVDVMLQIGNIVAEVNGKVETLLSAPEISNSTTMVPLRFLSETFGAEVTYDPDTAEITVLKGATANGDSIVEGAIDNEFIGDSFYGWSMKNPMDAVMTARYFDGSYTEFEFEDGEYIFLSISKTDEEYDFEENYDYLKSSYQGYTLSRADKDVADENKKVMFFQAKNKVETEVTKLIATDKYEFYLFGLFSNDSSDTKTAGISTIESFDTVFAGDDIYDLSNVENGARKFESEFLKLSFDVPQDFLMLSDEEAENDFVFASEDQDVSSGILASVYSKKETVNAKALAERDYALNKKTLNEELSTFFSGVVEKAYGDIKGYEYAYETRAMDMDSYNRDFFFDLGEYVYNIHVYVDRETADAEKVADNVYNSIEAEELDFDEVGIILYTKDVKTGSTVYDDVRKCEFTLSNMFTKEYASETEGSFSDEHSATQINILCDTSEEFTYATAKNQIKQVENTYSKMEGVTIVEPTSDKTINKKKFASLLMKLEEEGSVSYAQMYVTNHDGFAYLIVVTYHELGYSENSRTMVKDFMNSIKFK